MMAQDRARRYAEIVASGVSPAAAGEQRNRAALARVSRTAPNPTNYWSIGMTNG
jgi:hypothetical protein